MQIKLPYYDFFDGEKQETLYRIEKAKVTKVSEPKNSRAGQSGDLVIYI